MIFLCFLSDCFIFGSLARSCITYKWANYHLQSSFNSLECWMYQLKSSRLYLKNWAEAKSSLSEELKLAIPTILFSLIHIPSSVSRYSTNNLVLETVFLSIDWIFVYCLEEEKRKELIALGLSEWSKSRVNAEIPKYRKQVPKILNPRHIQQPR